MMDKMNQPAGQQQASSNGKRPWNTPTVRSFALSDVTQGGGEATIPNQDEGGTKTPFNTEGINPFPPNNAVGPGTPGPTTPTS
jgi:hypothetical protein